MLATAVPDLHQLISFAILKPWGERPAAPILQQQLQANLNMLSGTQAVALIPSMLPGSQNGFTVEFMVMGHDYQSLYSVTQQIVQKARQSGLFLFVQSDLQYDQPEAMFQFDHNKMNDLGVNSQQVADLLSLSMSNNRIQQYDLDGQNYDVVTQLAPQFRTEPQQLLNQEVMGKDNKMIPLSSFTTIQYQVVPYQLNQFQGQDAVMIMGEVMPPHSLSDALSFLNQTAGQVMTPDMNTAYAGASLQFEQEGHSMLQLFIFGFLVIYLILMLLFQSYKDALIILLGSVPLTLLGGLAFLWLGVTDLNIYTEIGLLTLIGLVSKHGILIVKFANEFIEAGLSPKIAIIKAASLRLRPILMTTAAMFFGALPLLFSIGGASESKFNLGLVICSGIVFGTCMTLFILPGFYLLIKTQLRR